MESLIANLIEELSKEGKTQKQAYLQISAMGDCYCMRCVLGWMT